MVEKSKAYLEFIEDTERMRPDGYKTTLLQEIFPEERKEVEDRIVYYFLNKDPELAYFLMDLRYHDGKWLLENTLRGSSVPGEYSIKCASYLYKATNEEKYLDVLRKNMESENYLKRIIVLSSLVGAKPSEKLREFYVDACLTDENRTVRSAAATGILYCDRIIKKIFDDKEYALFLKNEDNRQLKLSLSGENITERKKALQYLEEKRKM